MADLLHRVRRWLWLLRNPMRRVELLRQHGRCLECGVKLTAEERHYYDMNCERCEAYTLYAGRATEPPICADTGEPKDPGNCWNVRCQLGGTCCRAPGVVGTSKGDSDGR